jgi:hypothetical protein
LPHFLLDNPEQIVYKHAPLAIRIEPEHRFRCGFPAGHHSEGAMSVLHGSCLCGGVKFEITGPLLRPLNCHCTFCRKQHGAAFRSRARVRRTDFRWVNGEDLLSWYEATPGYRRGFCRVCGSPVVNRAEPHSHLAQAQPQALDEFGIALGTLDDDPGIRPESHIFVRSKAPWFEITDDLPQYEGYPPRG